MTRAWAAIDCRELFAQFAQHRCVFHRGALVAGAAARFLRKLLGHSNSPISNLAAARSISKTRRGYLLN